MTIDPRDDVVAQQYERWVYPEPIEDLPGWLQHHWQWFDPSHAHRVLWPDRGYPAGLTILVAGCGANQAAVLAYTNPSAEVVGMDVSAASLAHHEVLKERYGLRNLTLHRLPIEEVGALGQEFDLIVSTGVLHHLDDPQAGIDALASRLRRDGVLALMLYAHYGRLGVEVMASVFDDLALTQDHASVAIVREALATLPNQHPLEGYRSVAPDLGYDAGLVDTFLHGRARDYTVGQCLDLVAASGLVFQDWFLRWPYEPAVAPGNAFLETVRSLPDRERWSVMERINTVNACHFLLACRADRPSAEYRVDPDSAAFDDVVPVFRSRCGIDAGDLVLATWRMPLSPEQRCVAELVDGRRTVQEIKALSGDPSAADPTLREMWRLDAITFVIRT